MMICDTAAANIDVLEDVDLVLPAATFFVLRLPSVPLLRGRPLLVKALAEDLRTDEKTGATFFNLFVHRAYQVVILKPFSVGGFLAGGGAKARSETTKRGEKKGADGKNGPGLRLLLHEFLRPGAFVN